MRKASIHQLPCALALAFATPACSDGETQGTPDTSTDSTITNTSDTADSDDETSGESGDSNADSAGDGDGDETTTTGDGDDETTTGDGDETTTTGDGDGDETTTTGDGDGETTTTGDGDGDETTTTTGDGDGETTTTTGDGDGDETTTTGDGDGTTGDGDGDGDCIAEGYNCAIVTGECCPGTACDLDTSICQAIGDGDGDGDGTTGDGDGDGTTGDGDGDSTTGDGDGDGDGGGTTGDGDGDGDADETLLTEPNLWFAVNDKLIYFKLDPVDGVAMQMIENQITNVPPLNNTFNALTMRADGSLLGTRAESGSTQFYYVASPPLTASDVEVEILGLMPDGLWISALYTDCEGRIYLSDTGNSGGTGIGNRLLRFTGDYLNGDFSYEVITDLGGTSPNDIDDMSPGIDAMGQITDGQGFMINSNQNYEFNYLTGTGVNIGAGGDWGNHAIGGPLFDDGTARLYVLSKFGNLFQFDFAAGGIDLPSGSGPAIEGANFNGWSGLAGPLTECVSTFPG